MRQAVQAAWLAFTGHLEGGTNAPVIYQDIRGKVTGPYGTLCDSAEAVARLPLNHPDGRVATAAERVAAFHAVKSDPHGARLGWTRAATLTSLRFNVPDMHAMALAKLASNDRVLSARLDGCWDNLGACAQMATHSLAWACGANAHFPRFFQAVRDGNFAQFEVHIVDGKPVEVPVPGCAVAEIHMNEWTPEGLHNKGLIPRNVANKLLMRNAARVLAYHLDPEYLNWKTVLGPSEAVTVPDLSSVSDDAPTSPGGDNAASSQTTYPIVHADPHWYGNPPKDEPDPEAA